MGVGIVDNSTMTATQRLLGDVQVANLHNIDGDIVAFENLIQSILFYDELYFVDDYKPEYRSSRASRFPFLKPVSFTERRLADLEALSRETTDDLALRVERGDITTAILSEFFDQLKLHFVFAWQMSGSDFLLNLKLLGASNFDADFGAKVLAMIGSQRSDRERTSTAKVGDDPAATFISSDGRDVSKPHEHEGKNFSVGEDVKLFIQNLSWLCQRTAFYSILCNQCDADAVLHPLRASFALSFAGAKLGLESSLRQRIIGFLKKPAEKTLVEIKSASDPTSLVYGSLPLFSAWIAKSCDSPNDFFGEAYRLKEHPKIVGLRQRFDELDSLGDVTSRTQRTNKLIQEINQALDLVRSDFSINTPNGPSLSPIVKVSNAALAMCGHPSLIPDLGLRLPTTRSHPWRSRGYRGVFRSIINDLGAVAKLGAVHEKLTLNVRRSKDAKHPEPKIEPPELRYAKPYWKRPM